MAGPAIGIGAGIGLGAIRNHQKQAAYNRDKELAAQMEQWSPWTGVHGQMPTRPSSSFEDMLQGATSGGMMGMNIANMGAAGAANPMAGAQQVGVNPALSSFAQPPGAGMMSGSFEQSPWAVAQRAPTFYG